MGRAVMEAPIVGLVVLVVAYPVVFLVLIIVVGRAAAASSRVDEEAADPVNAAAEQLFDELEALVNATHCDCPRCTARRRRVTP